MSAGKLREAQSIINWVSIGWEDTVGSLCWSLYCAMVFATPDV